MTTDDVIYAKLSAVGATYPGTMPVGATLPGMSYLFLPGGQISRHHSGVTKFRRRLQVNCWAKTRAAAVTLSDSVRVALDINQTDVDLITAENLSDLNEPEAELYRRIVEFYVYE